MHDSRGHLKTSRIAILIAAVGMVAALAIAASGGAGSVLAQEQGGRRLPTHGDWQAIVIGEGATRQCVALSLPEEIQPEGLTRGSIAILVSHQLNNQEFSIVQVKMGYPVDTSVPVKIDIDGERWELFGDKQNAWPYDLDDNEDILRAMKAGLEMYVEGRSQRGNTTMDRYSLRGITAAIREIDSACDR